MLHRFEFEFFREPGRAQNHLLSEYYEVKKCLANPGLFNHHVLKRWQLQDPESRKHRGLLSLMRRHQWSLSQDQRQRLTQYLEPYPVLKALYRAKQRLMRFLLLKTVKVKRAKKLLPRFLALIEQFANSPDKTLTATLTSWREAIVGMWRLSKFNGIREGFHTKMEMISRRAFGFRNFENYRLRVLALCGWNGLINRV